MFLFEAAMLTDGKMFTTLGITPYVAQKDLEMRVASSRYLCSSRLPFLCIHISKECFPSSLNYLLKTSLIGFLIGCVAILHHQI